MCLILQGLWCEMGSGAGATERTPWSFFLVNLVYPGPRIRLASEAICATL